MANITSGDSVESFLVQYFQPQQQISLRPATPSERIPLVPLLLMPHDWHVLDANAKSRIYSTRSHLQTSCNGLFPRLEVVRQDDRGEWFVAHTEERTYGWVSTARLRGEGDCRVDAVARDRHMAALPILLEAAVDWARTSGATRCHVAVSIEDTDKQERFEELGFTATAERAPSKWKIG